MGSVDEFVKIDTPENVAFDFELVGIGSRFLAALVDTSLIILLQVLTIVPMMYFISDATAMVGSFALGLLGFIAFVLFWGYYIVCELTMNGQSPGKRLAHIRVLRRDGMPVALTDSAIRNLVRIVDFMPALYGLGVVVMFIDGQSRRLGDLAAGTVVVREQNDVSLESLSVQEFPSLMLNLSSDMHERVQSYPFERLEPTDIRLAEEYLKRRRNLVSAETMGFNIWHRWAVRMQVPSHTIRQSDLVPLLSYGLFRHQQQGDRRPDSP